MNYQKLFEYFNQAAILFFRNYRAHVDFLLLWIIEILKSCGKY